MSVRIVLSLVAVAGLALQAAQGQTLDLWRTIQRGERASIEAYLSSGGDPNGRAAPPRARGIAAQGDEASWPLLKIALYDREEEIALALLEAGAEFDGLGESLGLVAGQGMPRVLKYLITQDPRRLREAAPIVQSGLLQSAVAKGYYQSLEVALLEGRRVQLRWDPTALADAAALAIADRQSDIARMLYEAGAPLKDNAIRVAARDSSPGMVRYVLSLGADPNGRLSEDQVNPGLGLRTAMDYVWYRYDHTQGQEREIASLIMFELLRAGASANAGRPDDVATNGLALLEAIIDPSERLIEAARLGYYEIVEGVVRYMRPSRDAMREATSTALRSLHNDIAALLIKAGAPVDSGPLHAAAMGNSPGLVREILARGADPNQRVGGQTAAEQWWERAQHRDFGAAGDLVLHELINGGSDVCWLAEHYDSLNLFSANFMRNTATQCWPQ